MFDGLTEKFSAMFSKFVRARHVTESGIQEAVDEVRLALLDRDVQYGIVKQFIKNIKEKAVGQKLVEQVSPGQLFIKLVHDELVTLLGSTEQPLVIDGRPGRILLCGLQGSGKTTSCVKLAYYLKAQKRFVRPCVVACDLARPAAITQLQLLAGSHDIACFAQPHATRVVDVVNAALDAAIGQMWDLLIFDTAGRLHIDQPLMEELSSIKNIVKPQHVLLTMNAATGQDAVRVAATFAEQIGITGSCLTMLDGSSKAGAALSVAEVTKRPIFFEGHGERVVDLRPFHPQSLADRVLGMGDTINLVRHAQALQHEVPAEQLEKRLREGAFTYDDVLQQMSMIRKMGPMQNIMAMIPGASQLPIIDGEKELGKTEAIIRSMTGDERTTRCELSVSRRRRIANGSGTSIDDVNKLVKTLKQMKQLFQDKSALKRLGKIMGGVCR